MGGSSPGEGAVLSEWLVTSRRAYDRRHKHVAVTSCRGAAESARWLRSVPEDVGRHDELLVGQVISELGQEVHVGQLPPKLVTAGEQDARSHDRRQGAGGERQCFYLSRGLKMFHTIRMKFVGWTT